MTLPVTTACTVRRLAKNIGRANQNIGGRGKMW